MSINTDCDRLRLEGMAALDGEGDPLSEGNRAHLSVCPACQEWLANLAATTARFEKISYPEVQVPLWAAVEGQLRRPGSRLPVLSGLWPLAALMLGGRALQLSLDLPMALHLVLPLAAAATLGMLWKLAGDPLAIETWVPELRKGEI